jgi:hypothetical protein
LEECKIGTWQENGIIFGPTKYLEKISPKRAIKILYN